ncbi:unnamed protein product, partial [Amoebophrya sp. A25]
VYHPRRIISGRSHPLLLLRALVLAPVLSLLFYATSIDQERLRQGHETTMELEQELGEKEEATKQQRETKTSQAVRVEEQQEQKTLRANFDSATRKDLDSLQTTWPTLGDLLLGDRNWSRQSERLAPVYGEPLLPEQPGPLQEVTFFQPYSSTPGRTSAPSCGMSFLDLTPTINAGGGNDNLEAATEGGGNDNLEAATEASVFEYVRRQTLRQACPAIGKDFNGGDLYSIIGDDGGRAPGLLIKHVAVPIPLPAGAAGLKLPRSIMDTKGGRIPRDGRRLRSPGEVNAAKIFKSSDQDPRAWMNSWGPMTTDAGTVEDPALRRAWLEACFLSKVVSRDRVWLAVEYDRGPNDTRTPMLYRLHFVYVKWTRETRRSVKDYFAADGLGLLLDEPQFWRAAFQMVEAVESLHSEYNMAHLKIGPESFVITESEDGAKVSLSDAGYAVSTASSVTMKDLSGLRKNPETEDPLWLGAENRRPHGAKAKGPLSAEARTWLLSEAKSIDLWDLGVTLSRMIVAYFEANSRDQDQQTGDAVNRLRDRVEEWCEGAKIGGGAQAIEEVEQNLRDHILTCREGDKPRSATRLVEVLRKLQPGATQGGDTLPSTAGSGGNNLMKRLRWTETDAANGDYGSTPWQQLGFHYFREGKRFRDPQAPYEGRCAWALFDVLPRVALKAQPVGPSSLFDAFCSPTGVEPTQVSEFSFQSSPPPDSPKASPQPSFTRTKYTLTLGEESFDIVHSQLAVKTVGSPIFGRRVAASDLNIAKEPVKAGTLIGLTMPTLEACVRADIARGGGSRKTFAPTLEVWVRNPGKLPTSKGTELVYVQKRPLLAQTLDKFLEFPKQGLGLDLHDVAGLLAGMAEEVLFLHDKGWAHMDITPGAFLVNVASNADEKKVGMRHRVAFADFASARPKNHKWSHIVKTHIFASEEYTDPLVSSQIRDGKDVPGVTLQESDTWSLGVTLSRALVSLVEHVSIKTRRRGPELNKEEQEKLGKWIGSARKWLDENQKLGRHKPQNPNEAKLAFVNYCSGWRPGALGWDLGETQVPWLGSGWNAVADLVNRIAVHALRCNPKNRNLRQLVQELKAIERTMIKKPQAKSAPKSRSLLELAVKTPEQLGNGEENAFTDIAEDIALAESESFLPSRSS